MTEDQNYRPFEQVCCADCRYHLDLSVKTSPHHLCTHPDLADIPVRSPITGKTVYVKRNGPEGIEFPLPSPLCETHNSLGDCRRWEQRTKENGAGYEHETAQILYRDYDFVLLPDGKMIPKPTPTTEIPQ